MTQSKRTRDALLNRSVAAMQAGRGAAAGAEQGGGVVWLPLAEVMPDPDQPRTHIDEGRLRSLVDSIAAVGQIEPVLVQALRPDEQKANPGFRYRCLSGHRRLRAHAELGLGEIKAVVVREALDPSERLVREIAANEVREDHTDYDRARFLAQVFANRLADVPAAGTSGARGVERAKQAVNRAFNEFDRTGAFSAVSRAVVEALEAELKAIGERRNLRWFHRWGAPLLALEGAAMVAAVAGLDARRALAISQLSPRSGAIPDVERAARERAVETLAGLLRAEPLPHRDVAALVRSIGQGLLAADDPAALVEAHFRRASAADEAMAESAAESGGASPTPEGGKGKARRRARSAPSAALARWGVRLGAGDRYTALSDVVAKATSGAPRRAEKIAELIAKLDDELEALGGAPPKRKR